MSKSAVAEVNIDELSGVSIWESAPANTAYLLNEVFRIPKWNTKNVQKDKYGTFVPRLKWTVPAFGNGQTASDEARAC